MQWAIRLAPHSCHSLWNGERGGGKKLRGRKQKDSFGMASFAAPSSRLGNSSPMSCFCALIVCFYFTFSLATEYASSCRAEEHEGTLVWWDGDLDSCSHWSFRLQVHHNRERETVWNKHRSTISSRWAAIRFDADGYHFPFRIVQSRQRKEHRERERERIWIRKKNELCVYKTFTKKIHRK